MLRTKDRAAYEERIAALEAELTSQKDRADNAERRLRIYEKYNKNPEDCVQGRWCSGCAFGISRTVNVTHSADRFINVSTICVCGKGLCKHFTPKEDPP